MWTTLRKTIYFLAGSLVLLFGTTSPGEAQPPQFSHYQYTPLQVNPALVGTSSYATAITDFRRQQYAGGMAFRTTLLSGSYPLFNRATKQQVAGFGLSLLDDRTTEFYSFQQLNLNVAHPIQLGPMQWLSLGLQVDYSAKRLSTDGLTTGSQFLPERGFSPGAPTGEFLGNFSADFFSIHTGAYWYRLDEDDRQQAYAGLAVYHLNRPNESFTGQSSPLPMSVVMTAGWEIYRQQQWAVRPEVLVTHRGGGSWLSAGSMVQYELQPGNRRTPATTLDMAARYTTGQSMILSIQWVQPQLVFGFAYDVPLGAGRMQPNPSRGAAEFLLAFRKPVEPKNKKRRRKRSAKKRTKSSANRTTARRAPQPQPSGQEPTSTPPRSVAPNDSTALAAGAPSERGDTVAVAADVHRRHGFLQAGHLPESVLFGFNQTEVVDEQAPALEAVAQLMHDNPSLRLTLVGHTDNLGASEVNQQISEARAASVKQYLVRRGVAAERMTVEGEGERSPKFPNTDSALRSRNRRVEFRFVE
ncbi:type IX secretion system membrane protein, PorP/SprF family [Catalinimonas alkaloidigena]|uniref:Type IX secretion system membrane protein, PorP/SprF family n=1 Tax=Catalinimonas alkaloidigena TaxID=1075417 RepID=A0A1G9RJ19_9BACT|nr:PorP/SprF family type IX secretion system membrane protein [Catalinimonas alkaloidigena]SDM23213.1 type IX secretion system membrane protein, PorP/SprF family [Catalinimonas alkaloidigena]